MLIEMPRFQLESSSSNLGIKAAVHYARGMLMTYDDLLTPV